MIKFNSFLNDESGVTAIEYALIAALIAVAAITAMSYLGGEIATTFNFVGDAMASTNTGTGTGTTNPTP